MQSSAYGASLAGGAFDLENFLKQPQTILRFLSWIFSIVVFATITGEGYVNTVSEKQSKCIFNGNDGACSYGLGIGVLAFLACISFLILDAYLPQMSNAAERKYVVLGDLLFSGVWTFLWFICFCVLANQWSKSTDDTSVSGDAARAIVAFSFFSIFSWGLLTYFALGRYRQGVTDLNQQYRDPANDPIPPYPPAPYTSAPSGYQQSPFSHSQEQQGDYQPPAY